MPKINANNVNGKLTVTVPHIDGAAEVLAEWKLDEDTGSVLQIGNASSVNGLFGPQIVSARNGANSALNIQCRAGTDSGTFAICTIDGRIGTSNASVTRDVFGVNNNGTTLFRIGPTGALTITGPVATSGGINFGTYLTTTQANSAGTFSCKVTGDTLPRWQMLSQGKLEWGSGSAAMDTNLYRSAADSLKTDDDLTVGGNFTTNAGNFVRANTTDNAILVYTPNTSGLARYVVRGDGQILWGDGTNARDTNLYRIAADQLATDDDLVLNTAGKGIRIKEGSNARMGVATLVGGAVTISNTSVTANTRIFYSVQAVGGTQGLLSATRVNGTSFTITSTSGSDTSVIAWELKEPS